VNAAAFSILLLVPYYLAQIASMPAARGGLMLSAAAIGAIGGSLAAGRFAALFGRRRTAGLGVVVCATGLAAVGSWSETTHAVVQCAALLVQGVGVGLFQVAYTDLVIAAMPIKERGVAGSLAVVTRTIGVVGGAAGLSTLFERAHVRALATGLPAPEAFLAAFHATFLWTWIGLFAVVILTLARPSLFLAER
jgi:MFS family permease